MVAMPDFAFGAMENWGLILYKETKVLPDYSCEYILCENWCHCNTHTVERRDVSDSTSPMTKIVTEPGENLEVGGDVHVYIPSRGSVRQFSHHKPSPGDESRKSIHPLHIDPYGTSPPP